MDRSKVRIGLITIGIITGLTLILYLPVLIWSPPWSENGIYHCTEWPFFLESSFPSVKESFISRNDNSNLYFYQFNGELGIHGLSSNYSDALITKSDGTLQIELTHIGETIYYYRKVSDPFTLWYIKWLEWMNN